MDLIVYTITIAFFLYMGLYPIFCCLNMDKKKDKDIRRPIYFIAFWVVFLYGPIIFEDKLLPEQLIKIKKEYYGIHK